MFQKEINSILMKNSRETNDESKILSCFSQFSFSLVVLGFIIDHGLAAKVITTNNGLLFYNI